MYEELKRQEKASVERKPSVKFLDGAVRKSLAFSLSKKNEVKILRYLNDAGAEADFVPKILESNEENQYFVMERVDGVSLQVILDNLEEIEGKDFSAIIKAVKTALDRLHSYGVLHQDPHSGNFLLQWDQTGWKCVIIDFGESFVEKEEQKRKEASFLYHKGWDIHLLKKDIEGYISKENIMILRRLFR